jgi:hypothetical protein
MASFRISEKYSFSDVDFEYRDGSIKRGRKRKEPCTYIFKFNPIVGEFWKKAEKLKNKKGCYVYAWASKPIYIGKACGENGFYQECFHPEKLKKITNFIKMSNSSTYKQRRQHLHIYFIYLDGKRCQSIDDFAEEMETSLILKCVNEYGKDQLINTKKVNFKWSIKGFMGNNSHVSLKGETKKYKENVALFKQLLSKNPAKK